MRNDSWLKLVFLNVVMTLTPTSAVAQERGLGLYVINADGSELRPLLPTVEYDRQGSPDWSPDGKKIAFDAWRESAGEEHAHAKLFTIDADGGELKLLGDGVQPSYSADGMKLAFSRNRPNRGVWIMDVDGKNKRLVDEEGWSAQWSPDGRTIAYTVTRRTGANIIVYDVRTQKRRDVLLGEHASRYRYIKWNFDWSPDSTKLCFRGDRTEELPELAIVHIEGSIKHFEVVFERQFSALLSWHPDGARILLSTQDPMRRIRQLFTSDLNRGGQLRYVTGQPANRSNGAARWSPDGNQIVFSSRKKQ